jgi:hypothetical protein
MGVSTLDEAPLSNSSIDLDEFRFPLPRETVSVAKGEQITTVRLHNGTLIFHNTLRDEGWIVSESVQNDRHVEKLLGQEILHSKRKLIEAAMLATPKHVKWWRFRSSQNEKAELLLLEKFWALNLIPNLERISHIYTIASGELRGFQFGDPQVPPYDAHLDLFDGADRHFQFDIYASEGQEPVLTQQEVNAIISSIRPVQPQVSLHIENIEKH